MTELKRVLVDIELVIRSELDYFDDKQFEAYQNLDESRYQVQDSISMGTITFTDRKSPI